MILKKIYSHRKITLIILIILLSTIATPASAEIKANGSSFSALSTSDLITAINNYRRQNGLNTLQINNTLTYLAQSHAEYQASLGTYTHTGSGGTSPKNRAISAGYNSGNVTYFAEIIYAGYNGVASEAINWWKNSYEHNSMMLSPAFNEIGAGIATDGTWNYFTVEFGYSSGVESPTNNSASSISPVISYSVPVVEATPREDGAVIHVIKLGQALWTLSVVYDIDLDLLLEQNGLTKNSYVYVEDEIIIVPSNTATIVPPTSTIAPTKEYTVTIEPSATKESTLTPSKQVTINETPTPQITETPVKEQSKENDKNLFIRRLIISAFAIFLVLLLISIYLPK